jgi:hypothetical protein
MCLGTLWRTALVRDINFTCKECPAVTNGFFPKEIFIPWLALNIAKSSWRHLWHIMINTALITFEGHHLPLVLILTCHFISLNDP